MQSFGRALGAALPTGERERGIIGPVCEGVSADRGLHAAEMMEGGKD